MPLIPLGLLEEIIRLINNIIQANREDPTSAARGVTLFWIFWPWAKPFLSPEQETQIEALVKAIQAPLPTPASEARKSPSVLVVPPLQPPATPKP